jgi:cystathionine gamma-synthase
VTAFDTRAVHAGHDPAQHNGSVTTPIYQVSTFVRPHARPVESGWDYSRIANPTRAALEECLAALEGGASAAAVASGMAACTTAIQALCRSGAHLVIHSTTKYLGGHSDITGGAVIAADAAVGATISWHVGMLGTAAAPQEAWLVQRGIKTLPVRMRQICASSQRIAEFLAAHPAVRQVHYPGLPGHPDHLLAAKQMPDGFGGVVSVELQGGAGAAGRVCEGTRVFTLAVSLGSVESLIEHPARMTHCTTAGTPVGVSDSLLRLSIGLEDCDELIADLTQALAGIAEPGPERCTEVRSA